MTHEIVRRTAVWIAVFSMSCGWAIDGKSINGRAVSIHWRYSFKNWGIAYNDAQGYWDGAIDLFTINSGRVVKVDTIFKATQGLCYSPAFDINACKIAFYRLDRALSTSTAKVSANGGKTTISVMKIDGSNIVNLADCPGEPHMDHDGDGGLDWPGGDWIYYLKPVSNGGYMNELWKVNVNTKENVNVCTYDLGGGRFRRFSLNLAATKIGNQIIDGRWYNDNVDPFPNGCAISSRSGMCNSCVSASGNYQAKFDGMHMELCLHSLVNGVKPPPTNINYAGLKFTGVLLEQFQALTPDQFSNKVASVEGLGFACNSDKWVLQHVGWYGIAGNMVYGSNQVACNWSDMACIRVSSNANQPLETCPGEGRPGPDCCAGCGVIYYGNEFGDLWVDGGAGNAGKYEDADGNWHSVAGAGTTYCPAGIVKVEQASSQGRIASAMKIAITRHMLEISFPANGAWRIDAVDGKGRTVAGRRISGTTCAMNLPRGMYIIRAQSISGVMKKTVFVD
jgi:hypothetical protein